MAAALALPTIGRRRASPPRSRRRRSRSWSGSSSRTAPATPSRSCAPRRPDRGRDRPRHALGRLPRDDHGRGRPPGRGGCSPRRSRRRPARYIAVVEGSIPTGANGAYCTIGGRSALQIAREVCGSAAATIAMGTCATFGGLPAAAPNPTGALGVADAVPGRQEPDQPLGLPGQRREPHGAHRLLPHLQALAGARRVAPAALRLRQGDPRQLRAARALRRRPVRGGVGRRGPPHGLLPLQDGLQGPGHVPELPERPLERGHQLADRLRPPVHRLRRARLLGQDDALLPHLPGVPGFGVASSVDKVGLWATVGVGAAFAAHGFCRSASAGGTPSTTRRPARRPRRPSAEPKTMRREASHDARRRRPRHPDRGPSADRGRGGRRRGARGVVLLDHVPRASS